MMVLYDPDEMPLFRKPDPDEPTIDSDYCRDKFDCETCSEAWNCKDCVSLAYCEKCHDLCKEENLFSGICKECLAEYVDPQTVKEYIYSLPNPPEGWESLFETYFSEPDDRCQIERVSETLKERLMKQIMLEFNWDKLGDTFHSKEKLVAWVGEDEVAWGDFADWLVEKKGVLK